MNLSTAELERLVRDVVSRMTGGAPAAEPLPPSREKGSAESGRMRGTLELTGDVVALADLEGKLADVTQLSVGLRAVVTPAVRDLLRQRKITLVRKAAGGATRKQSKPTVAVAVAAMKFEASRLVDRLRREGYGVQQLAQAGLAAAVREVCDEAARGGVRGLLVVDEAEAAVVAANRRPGVRALVGDDPQQVARATAAVDANVLVVRPTGKSDFLLQRLTTAWLTTRPNVNEQLRELLK